MALPTSGLTFHGDASVVTDLWQTNLGGGSFSNHPGDGGGVTYLDDVEHADILAGTDGGLPVPVWLNSATPMLLPCLDFNGTTRYLKFFADDGTTAKIGSDLITASAFTILIACRIDAFVTSDASAYNNDSLISDDGGYWGIHLKAGTDNKIIFYNYPNELTHFGTAAIDTNYVLMYRHESGTIYASINGADEISTGSGNTGSLASGVNIGKNGFIATFYDGKIGEIAIYNTALTGSDKSDAIGYFVDKWITGTPAGQPMARRFGGVPHVAVGSNIGRSGHRGRTWGRSKSGRVVVPAWMADNKRAA